MSRRLLCRIILIAVFAWLSGCASVPDAPKEPEYALPESFYVPRPWADQQPVDITRRVRAMQSALGSMQQAVNSYGAALQTQADLHNKQVFRQAELARAEEETRRLQALETQRQRNAEELKPALKINSKAFDAVARPNYTMLGWKLGEATALQAKGWSDWSRQQFWKNMRSLPQ